MCIVRIQEPLWASFLERQASGRSVGESVRIIGQRVRIIGQGVRIIGKSVRIIGQRVRIIGQSVRIIGKLGTPGRGRVDFRPSQVPRPLTYGA